MGGGLLSLILWKHKALNDINIIHQNLNGLGLTKISLIVRDY